MHDIVVEELERHLSGDASQAFYDHLDACADCTAAVVAMSEISVCLRELKVDEAVPEPSLGFYNRVANRIVEDQRKEAWGLFSPGAAFFRRVAAQPDSTIGGAIPFERNRAGRNLDCTYITR